jgi:hypothetical protein
MKEETNKPESKRTFVRLLTFDPSFYKKCKDWFELKNTNYLVPEEYKPIMNEIYWAILKIKWGGAQLSQIERIAGTKMIADLPDDLQEPVIKMQLKEPKGWETVKEGRMPMFNYAGADGKSRLTNVAAIPQVFMYIGEADDDNFKIVDYTEDAFKKQGPIADILSRIRNN